MDEGHEEMFCSSCGERIRSSSKFCRHCGAPNRHRDRVQWGPPPSQGDGPEATAESDRRNAFEGEHVEEAGGWDRTRRGAPASAAAPAPGPDDSVPWRSYLPEQARRVDPPTWRVVGGAIGLGLLGFVLLAIISVFAAGIGFALGLQLPVVLLGGTVIGQYLGFAGLSLWYLRHRGLDRERIKGYLGIRKPTLREIGLIFAAWLVIIIGALIISVLAQFLTELLGSGEPGQADQEITEILSENPEFVPIAIIIMFLVVGPCEEILFRGIVQGRLREHLSAVPAIGITSVFFAVLHVGGLGGSLQGILIAISVLTIAGLVLGSLYEYTQNLVVVSLLHGFHNSMIVLFVYADAVYDLEGSSAVVTSLVGALPV